MKNLPIPLLVTLVLGTGRKITEEDGQLCNACLKVKRNILRFWVDFFFFLVNAMLHKEKTRWFPAEIVTGV